MQICYSTCTHNMSDAFEISVLFKFEQNASFHDYCRILGMHTLVANNSLHTLELFFLTLVSPRRRRVAPGRQSSQRHGCGTDPCRSRPDRSQNQHRPGSGSEVPPGETCCSRYTWVEGNNIILYIIIMEIIIIRFSNTDEAKRQKSFILVRHTTGGNHHKEHNRNNIHKVLYYVVHDLHH